MLLTRRETASFLRFENFFAEQKKKKKTRDFSDFFFFFFFFFFCLVTQGKENSNLYRIKSGNCRVEKTNDAGERIQLATMGPKTMFGDTAVVPSMKVATADVVADSDVVEVHQIEVPIVYEILKSNPGSPSFVFLMFFNVFFFFGRTKF